jgi:hypothetical protein
MSVIYAAVGPIEMTRPVKTAMAVSNDRLDKSLLPEVEVHARQETASTSAKEISDFCDV